MLIGYMRVSTSDQSTDLQRNALIAAGVKPDHRYGDKASSKREDRPGLDACLKALRERDTLGTGGRGFKSRRSEQFATRAVSGTGGLEPMVQGH